MSEVTEPQSEFDRNVRANLPWNFSVNLIDLNFIILGTILVSRETVMPALVGQLTDSKVAIGLISATFAAGFYLPQLFFANYSERLLYKLPFVMWGGGMMERVPYLFIGIAVWLWGASYPTLTLVLFFLFLTSSYIGMGIATPAWFDIIAKAIPVERRGIFNGMGHGIGALMGLIGAYFVGRILEGYGYPSNYALLFVVAFVFMMISWVGLALNREQPSPVVKKQVGHREYLRRLPTVLRQNQNYSRFLISRSIIQIGAMSGAFFTAYGIDKFAIDGAGVAMLTAVLAASKVVTNLVWGVLGDRKGHKMVLVGAAITMILAGVSALMAQSAAWLIVTIALLGAYLAADEVSALSILMEFCEPEDRPTYIGLTNTLLAPGLIVAPIIGGWLVEATSYETTFMIALGISFAGAILFATWVREPRSLTTDLGSGLHG